MMQVNLSTSNSKKIKKRIRNLLAVVIFVIVIFLLYNFLGWLLLDDENRYTRITIHEMYTQEENIDVLFLGSSHVYRSLDTSITDEIFDANTFNGGTSYQSLSGSYALLAEADKKNDLDQVYVEMYYMVEQHPNDEMTPVYIISDYMKPSLNKAQFLLQNSDEDNFINSFFPARRYWGKLFSTEEAYLIDNLKYKFSKSYRSYAYVELEDEAYCGKGYVPSQETVGSGTFSRLKHFQSIKENLFDEDSDGLQYMKKIIDYCEKNDIELVFYSAPMPDFRLADVGNYDDYIEQVSAVCEEYGVAYYDFNLCTEEYFDFQNDYFKDGSHLNQDGAEAFSNVFSEFFTGQIEEEDLFYDSYAEKLEETTPAVYGVVYKFEEKGKKKKIVIEPVTNDTETTYYYTISKKVKGADAYEILQTLDENLTIRVKKAEKGTMKVQIYSDAEGLNMTNEITFSY